MKTLVITNQKGGVGKTTLVVNLAQFLSIEHKKKVAVVDLDTQCNASWTLFSDVTGCMGDVFFNPEMPNITADRDLNVIIADHRLANIEKMDAETLANRLTALKSSLAAQGVEILIIDTPPSMGNALVSSLLVSDYVLCPIELETFSIQGVKKMRTIISKIKTVNADLTELGLIPSRVENRNPTHRRQLVEMQQAYPGLISPVSVYVRGSIADAVANRTWIGENRKRSARKAIHELQAVTNWIISKTGLDTVAA